MDDPDVFAVLTPYEGLKGENASRAFGQSHNAVRYHTAAKRIITEPTTGSREPTPAPMSPSGGGPEFVDRILLKFSDRFINLAKGVQFGKNPNTSDVLLQYAGVRGVSARQFVFAVKEDRSWYLEDFFSSFGTAVGYDGKSALERRRGESWIISHPPKAPKLWKNLTIHAGDVVFEVDFPNQQAGRLEYVEKLEAFIAKSKRALPTLDALGLDSNPPTAAPSEPRTPHLNPQPIYIDYGEIGRGMFAAVHKVMNCRDGKFYAMKKFFRPSWATRDVRKRKQYEEAWCAKIRKEVKIMKDNAHSNIMPVIDFVETPDPFLITPYYELGNLQEYNPIDKDSTRRAVHRDIKPENFLIASTEPFNIIVADFGLSNVAIDDPLKTFCGTHMYCAPEVFPGNSDGYGEKADMWSLGVMMLQLMYRLPDTPSLPRVQNTAILRAWVETWSGRLREELAEWAENSDLVMDILLNMIKDDPKERFTADQCLQMGLEIGLFGKNRDDYIVGANDTEVNTPAEVAWQADSPGDGGKSPTPQSPILSTIAATKHSFGSSTLTGKLWEGSIWRSDVSGDGDASANALSLDEGSNSGTRKRQRTTSQRSSWSWTIGPGSSDSVRIWDSDGGRSGRTNSDLLIRKDQFTDSLERQFASEEEPQKRASVRQGSPALPEPEQQIGETVALASFEQRVLQLA